MEASFKGHIDIVKMLIKANVQINTQKMVNMCIYALLIS